MMKVNLVCEFVSNENFISQAIHFDIHPHDESLFKWRIPLTVWQIMKPWIFPLLPSKPRVKSEMFTIEMCSIFISLNLHRLQRVHWRQLFLFFVMTWRRISISRRLHSFTRHDHTSMTNQNQIKSNSPHASYFRGRQREREIVCYSLLRRQQDDGGHHHHHNEVCEREIQLRIYIYIDLRQEKQ